MDLNYTHRTKSGDWSTNPQTDTHTHKEPKDTLLIHGTDKEKGTQGRRRDTPEGKGLRGGPGQVRARTCGPKGQPLDRSVLTTPKRRCCVRRAPPFLSDCAPPAQSTTAAFGQSRPALQERRGLSFGPALSLQDDKPESQGWDFIPGSATMGTKPSLGPRSERETSQVSSHSPSTKPSLL